MNEHLSTDLLIDYLHGELSAADDAVTHAHLATCSSCRAEYDAEVRLGESLRAAASREERELPGFVRAAIWESVEREREPALQGRWSLGFLRPAFAVPAAAAFVVLGIVFAPFSHPGTGTPRVDAVYYLEAHAAQQAQNPLSEHGAASVVETSLLDGGPSATAPAPRGIAFELVTDSTNEIDAVH